MREGGRRIGGREGRRGCKMTTCTICTVMKNHITYHTTLG